MAGYLAMRILGDHLDYKMVFTKETFKQFKEDVDTILILEGRQDLIVEI